MKSKDFFNKLKETGKIESEDFIKFIDSVPEFEIPDQVYTNFEDKFLTLDRAVAHPDVDKKLRNRHLDPIDNDLDEILKFMDSIDKNTALEVSRHTRRNDKGETIRDTYKQLMAVKEALPKLFEKAKVPSSDEDLKKQINDLKKANHEYVEKFKTLDDDFKSQVTNIKGEYDEKLKNYQLDSLLDSMSKSYTFAEAYEKTRPVLQKSILGELKQSNKLQLVEKDGKTEIDVLNDQGLPRFNGNVPITISKLLEDAYKPFLKQSESNGQHQQVTVHKVETPQNQRMGRRTTVE